MVFSKKYKFCLFACLLFFACKSADCGCPMAEQNATPEQVINTQKEFKVITKP